MESYDENGDDGEMTYIDRRKGSDLMCEMVLTGGYKVGISTNPKREDRPNFIEINGEKVVCLAQGGECRQPGEFYSLMGLNDPRSWETPIISLKCTNECPNKWIVCEGHDHSNDGVRVFIINPYRNKFSGQFTRFCKDFDLIKQVENIQK